MKKINLLAAACLISAASASALPPALSSDPAIEKAISERLASMSIDEKVGQMCELTLGLLGQFDPNRSRPDDIYGVGNSFDIAPDRLDAIIGQYKIGSILNVADIALTPAQWCRIVEQIQEKSIEVMGIPTIYGLDMNHGASYTIGATLFPQNVNMGATFNRELARRGGEICAYETRASNVPWTYNPTVDLSRTPLWPRVWENYGEDAFLSAQLGTQAVIGMQGTDPNHIDRFHIAANLKHFMAYGSPVSGKDRTHSSVSDMELREKHFAPYLEAIRRGGLLSIMVNSTNNNGIPFHANARLLTQWLKEELDWDGLIVTDWADINNLYTREYIARDKKDAIAIAINAGIDMAMEPYNTDFCTLLKECVAEGKVPMSRIDDAVARVLRMKYRLGLFEHPNTIWTDYPLFGSDEFAASSRQAAVESMVLLKNDEATLPIAPGKRILVTGPNANSMRSLNGGWTYTWQGHLTDVLPISSRYNTILSAIRNRFGADNVVYAPGVTYDPTAQWEGNWGRLQSTDIPAAVEAAKDVDIIVACVGETSYCETPGNINDLSLAPEQRQLVSALAATGKPVVLILNEGRPRLVSDIVPLCPAVVDIMLPSNYGGDALASLLAGDENFSGRLPFTYPKHPAALITYDYKKGEHVETMEGIYNYNAEVDVQWQFGHGLSYTSFAYSNLTVDKPVFTASDVLTFSVDVTNSGARAGLESVLLFTSDLVASVSPDVRRLRQFEKISLLPGETKRVTLTVPAADLAFVGPDGRWRLEEGDFHVSVGSESITVSASATHVWDTPNR